MEIKVGDKFRHFKGFEIEIIGIGKHTETLEELVIYKHNNEIWARPKEMFVSRDDVSKRKDNITGQKYRFERTD